MFKRLRRVAAVIYAVALICSMIAYSLAQNKRVVLRLTRTQSPGSISDLTAQEFKRLVQEKSNGRVEINVYSNCGLSGSGPTKAIEPVQAGNTGTHSCMLPNVTNYDERFYSFWLLFLFPNPDGLLVLCRNGKVYQVVNGWCDDLEMEMLGINNAGSRRIFNSERGTTELEDSEGMSIRVPGANILIDLYRNYPGTNPMVMDFSEIYTSLQQKTIDGQENPIAVFDSSKFTGIQQYVTLRNDVRGTTIWMVSQRTMEKLSPEGQALIEERITEALDWRNKYLVQSKEATVQELRDGGTTITVLTDKQKAEL